MPRDDGTVLCILEEGQQHFETVGQAREWIAGRHLKHVVYRDDGVVVAWENRLKIHKMAVEVWQILIAGRRPRFLPGSQDSKLLVNFAKAESAPQVNEVTKANGEKHRSRLPAGSEAVMPPGMRITAKTPLGTIVITALDDRTRSYTWDGATRVAELTPRAKTTGRLDGSLGLFSDGMGEFWREHRGVTRCVAEEGQQHFKTSEEATDWIRKRGKSWPFVFRGDGLMVGWDKHLDSESLRAQVWQIYIDGKKPKQILGSQDDRIVVDAVEIQTVPLVEAVVGNDTNAVLALLAAGADANVRNSVGTPVLILAIDNESVAIAQALLKHGANANTRDANDWTPLMAAIRNAELVKALLAAGADVNAVIRTDDPAFVGETALIFAADDGLEDVVRLLLSGGADANVATPDGETALSRAVECDRGGSHRGVIRMLERVGKPR